LLRQVARFPSRVVDAVLVERVHPKSSVESCVGVRRDRDDARLQHAELEAEDALADPGAFEQFISNRDAAKDALLDVLEERPRPLGEARHAAQQFAVEAHALDHADGQLPVVVAGDHRQRVRAGQVHVARSVREYFDVVTALHRVLGAQHDADGHRRVIGPPLEVRQSSVLHEGAR
jgi:hypothetical protein